MMVITILVLFLFKGNLTNHIFSSAGLLLQNSDMQF